MTAKSFDNSSNLESADYHPEKEELTVAFRNGGVYTYYDVMPAIAAELMAASSPGTYLSQNVKGQYRYAATEPAEDGGVKGEGGRTGGETALKELIEQALVRAEKLPQSRAKALVATKLDEALLWLTRAK